MSMCLDRDGMLYGQNDVGKQYKHEQSSRKLPAEGESTLLRGYIFINKTVEQIVGSQNFKQNEG